MIKVEPYLIFDGDCRQAIEFYTRVFDAKEVKSQTFAEDTQKMEGSPAPPEDWKDCIFFATLSLGDGSRIMLSDRKPEKAFKQGTDMAVSLDFPSSEEMAHIFDKLQEGGSVEMPITETFWKAQFAIIIDQFGKRWLLNCQVNV